MRRIIIFLGLVAATGFADTIHFIGLPTNTAFGTYNGFASATVNGVQGFLLICDDYVHTTYVPSGDLQYDVSTLTAANPLEYARFVNPQDWETSVMRYEVAAILLDGLRNTGPESLLDLTAQYQYALWNLFTPSVPLPDSTSETLLADAERAAGDPGAARIAVYSHLLIYTPKDQFSSNQEFLAFSSWQPADTPSPLSGAVDIPEPEAWLLAAMGLAMLFVKPLVRRLQPQAVATSSKTRTMSR